MPLVIIAGHPCSGKSTVSQIISSQLKEIGMEVRIVSENDLFPDKNKCYTSARCEDTHFALIIC
jgi:uridine kinase